MEEIKKLLKPFELQAKQPKQKRKITLGAEDKTSYSLNLLNVPDEPDTVHDSLNKPSFQQGTDPLPGFDREVTCPLCKIKCDRGLVSLREKPDGASFAEFLDVAQVMFNQQEGRPALDIAEEILDNLMHFVRRHPQKLKSMRTVTKEDVHRHFKYNHERKTVTKIKEEVMQVLLSMLDVAVTSACQRQPSGKLSLCKEDANMLLHIVDRIHRTHGLKDDTK